MRFFYNKLPSFNRQARHYKDKQYFRWEKKNKDKQIQATYFSVAIKSKSVFKISYEDKWDKFFKKIRFAKELQTGDEQIDERLYIASDCRVFQDALLGSQEIRNLIKKLFSMGAESISCDGEHLIFKFKNTKTDHPLILDEVFLFQELLAVETNKTKYFFRDKYAVQIFYIECIIWALGGYSLASYFQFTSIKKTVHLDSYGLFFDGTMLGLALAGLLLVGFWLLMKGSSRSHRVLMEAFVVLCISGPLAGTQVLSDINIGRDTSKPDTVKVEIEDLKQVYHRSRKGRSSYYSYHMKIKVDENDPLAKQLPQVLDIEESVFHNLRNQKTAAVDIASGYLNYKWVVSIYPDWKTD